MVYSHLYSKNVYIRYLFVVFAPDLMIPPSVFDGRDGFAKGHGIRTSRHFLAPSWELTRKSAPISDWHFGNSTGVDKVTKLTTFPILIKQTQKIQIIIKNIFIFRRKKVTMV
jgi:hypothetical protein